jgi:hypothetical protein
MNNNYNTHSFAERKKTSRGGEFPQGEDKILVNNRLEETPYTIQGDFNHSIRSGSLQTLHSNTHNHNQSQKSSVHTQSKYMRFQKTKTQFLIANPLEDFYEKIYNEKFKTEVLLFQFYLNFFLLKINQIKFEMKKYYFVSELAYEYD